MAHAVDNPGAWKQDGDEPQVLEIERRPVDDAEARPALPLEFLQVLVRQRLRRAPVYACQGTWVSREPAREPAHFAEFPGGKYVGMGSKDPFDQRGSRLGH